MKVFFGRMKGGSRAGTIKRDDGVPPSLQVIRPTGNEIFSRCGRPTHTDPQKNTADRYANNQHRQKKLPNFPAHPEPVSYIPGRLVFFDRFAAAKGRIGPATTSWTLNFSR